MKMRGAHGVWRWLAALAVAVAAAPGRAQVISKELPQEFQGLEIRAKIGARAVITGKFTEADAEKLAAAIGGK